MQRRQNCETSTVIEFDYQLTGQGWSAAWIADDTGSARLSASYLSDALRHLLEAVALSVEGVPESRCSWDEEPGEYRWILRRSGEQVVVTILWFDDLWSGLADQRGRPVFETTQDAQALGTAVEGGARRLLDELGPQEYERQRFEHPFPLDALDRLHTAITGPDTV